MKGPRDGEGDGCQQQQAGQALFPRLHVAETRQAGPRAPPRNKMALYEQFTVPKDGSGDGSQQPQAGPALFPRLHVAETRRAGPRAPPRNKMALYEQFTIPSHRFMAASLPLLPTTCWSSINLLYVPQGVMYQHVPGYMNPVLAYMPAMNVGCHGGVVGPLSLNSSSTSTVVDGDAELQRVPMLAESSLPQFVTASQLNSMPSKKRKEKDDCAVPIYPTPRLSSNRPWSHRQPEAPASQEAAHQHSQETREAGQEKRWFGDTGCSPRQFYYVQHPHHRKERSFEDMSSEQGDVMSWRTGSGECVTASGDDPDSSRRDTDAAQPSHYSLTATPSLVQEQQGEEESLRARLEQSNNSCESSEDQSGEVSEPVQCDRGYSADESECSILDCLPAVRITPRNVMDAIGQQEFWRARKAILRQQKMFSVQLFELHRLIQVQKLMAVSPDLMIELDVPATPET